MITLKQKSDCPGCGACMNACPTQCIRMRPDAEGFLYPEVDGARCARCGRCVQVCQIGSPPGTALKQPSAFAAKANAKALQLQSTSGGVFPLLAEHVLRQGGVVYGAAMPDGAEVRHCRVEDIAALAPLRGSKYTQSSIGGSYRQAREDLAAGRRVLFTGTPCQIGGLRHFLGDVPCEGLVCQDILCHGVPSPKAWRLYVAQKGFDPDQPMEAHFRDKSTGWADSSIVLRQGARAYQKRFARDSYRRAFVADIMLRPSCSACMYKMLRSRADITLGDFWGVERVLPDFADDDGVSLVFTHTSAGRGLFEAVAAEMQTQPVGILEAVAGNQSAVQGAGIHPRRAEFLAELDSRPFERLVSAYVKDPIWIRALRYAQRKFF